MIIHYWPSRPIVTADHVQRAVQRAKSFPKGTPEHNVAWRKADKISKEYYTQTAVYKYNSDVYELVKILEEMHD